ncbi:MAG: 30S ribosomal protein S16 [Patescibacteria group bacterium]
MLKIKLARYGKTHQPEYRIVVNEAKDKRDGKYVALVGRYSPTSQPKVLTFKMEEYDAWVKKGAVPTETVASLAERYKSGKPFAAKKAKLSKKAKAKLEAAKQAEAEEKQAAAEPAAESSTAEAEAPAVTAEAETKSEATETSQE